MPWLLRGYWLGFRSHRNKAKPMQAKITKRAVDSAIPLEGKALWVWDTEMKGFGLRVYQNGQKVYVIEYRPGDGGRSAPKRRVTIGKHGSPWTPETARKEAERLLGLVRNGADPAADKTSHKAAPTVSDLGERFLKEHADTKRKPATAKQYRRLLDLFIGPSFGRKKVGDVTRQDVMKLHSGLNETPYQANRVLALVSTLFTFAERVGERPDGTNPARHVERFKEHARERMLSGEELGRLGDALAASSESPYAVAMIKLLILTGARLGEVLGMRREWVDFERGEARLPDSKTGRKTVQLPPAALQVLAALPRLADNPYVICGERPGAHLVGVQRPWQRIRKAAGLDGLRIHDLRHAFASVAVCSGMGLPIIGKLLGHTQAVTTQRYAHLASDPLKAAAATVAGKIADAMNGSPPDSGQVVGMPNRKA
jgi:integrase